MSAWGWSWLQHYDTKSCRNSVKRVKHREAKLSQTHKGITKQTSDMTASMAAEGVERCSNMFKLSRYFQHLKHAAQKMFRCYGYLQYLILCLPTHNWGYLSHTLLVCLAQLAVTLM